MALPSTNVRDLTGEVKKTEGQYFANGGIADIWKGEWVQRGGDTVQVAIKVIRNIWDQKRLANFKKKFMREARVWSQISHPNVTPFFGVCFDQGRASEPALVCPYYPNGDVNTYLQEHSETDRMKLVAEVASGLLYLHSQNVIHGDIKASNVLVNNDLQASLTDFGLSRIMEASGFTTKTVGGTCRWMAAELIAPDGDDDDDDDPPRVTTATDVWAFAMTVIEILTGRVPYSDTKYETTVILTVMKGGRPKRSSCPEISDDVWTVLQQCWATDPNQRPSMRVLALYFSRLSLSRWSPSEAQASATTMEKGKARSESTFVDLC